MTKDEIFDKIDDVYSEHDGGTIYLSDERTERLKEIIQQAINFIPCCTELKAVKKEITFNKWLEVNGYYYNSYRIYEDADKKLISQAELERKYKKEISL